MPAARRRLDAEAALGKTGGVPGGAGGPGGICSAWRRFAAL